MPPSTFGAGISAPALAVSGLSSGLVKVGAGCFLQNAIAGTDANGCAYLTGIGNYATTTGSAISISTSTASFNGGLTFGNTFVVPPQLSPQLKVRC